MRERTKTPSRQSDKVFLTFYAGTKCIAAMMNDLLATAGTKRHAVGLDDCSTEWTAKDEAKDEDEARDGVGKQRQGISWGVSEEN